MAEYYEKSTIITFLRYGVPSNCMMTPNHIERMLDCIPAVDAVPVIHGRWVKPEQSMWSIADCSVCGKMCIVANTAKYCPNCGAKMDENEDI